jgi:hypothetical protein
MFKFRCIEDAKKGDLVQMIQYNHLVGDQFHRDKNNCYPYIEKIRPRLEVSNIYTGISPSTTFGIATTSDCHGNIYIMGGFKKSLQLDNLYLTTDTEALFIARRDRYNEWRWAKIIGTFIGQSNELITGSIDVDLEGNIYIACTCYGSFTMESKTYNDTTSFIVKIHSDGCIRYVKPITGLPNNKIIIRSYLCSDKCDSPVFLYVAGHFKSNIHFDDISLVSHNISSMYIAILDPMGNWIWATTDDTPPTNDLIYRTSSMMPPPPLNETTQPMIINGTTMSKPISLNINNRSISNVDLEPVMTTIRINDMRIDIDGSVVIIGDFTGYLKLGCFKFKQTDKQISSDFIARLSCDKVWTFVRMLSCSNYATANKLVFCPCDNNMMVVGHKTNDVKIICGNLKFYDLKLYVVKLDCKFKCIWMKEINVGNIPEICVRSPSVHMDRSGSLYITDDFEGGIHFETFRLVSQCQSRFIVKINKHGHWVNGTVIRGLNPNQVEISGNTLIPGDNKEDGYIYLLGTTSCNVTRLRSRNIGNTEDLKNINSIDISEELDSEPIEPNEIQEDLIRVGKKTIVLIRLSQPCPNKVGVLLEDVCRDDVTCADFTFKEGYVNLHRCLKPTYDYFINSNGKLNTVVGTYFGTAYDEKIMFVK